MSVSSVSSSSSIYGNRNVISGLASGLDTESMLENIVSGTKAKIESLQKRSTKLMWQQEAFRNIIDKMVNFSTKYTSYTSNTNLFSASFFNNAIKIATNGANADKISATGKTSSDIQIMGVKQLATAATYNVSGGYLTSGSVDSASTKATVSSPGSVNLEAPHELSNVSGSLNLKYGTRDINITFEDGDIYKTQDEFRAGIQKKLDEMTVSNSKGELVKASDMVKVELKDDKIVFSDKQNAGNNVYVSSASGKIKDTLGIVGEDKADSLNLKKADGSDIDLYDNTTKYGDYLAEKEIAITLDGVTKTIKMPAYKKADGTQLTGDEYAAAIQDAITDKFGANKINVTNKLSTLNDGNMQLEFQATQKGSSMSINFKDSAVSKALGFKEEIETSYINTGRTLGDLMGGLKNPDGTSIDDGNLFGTGSGKVLKAEGEVEANNNGELVDEKGNKVKKDTDGSYVRIGEDGETLYGYDLEVNGVTIGTYTRDTALDTIMVGINNNTEAGVKVTYSKTSNQFQFTAQETGVAGKIEFGEGLAQGLFGKVNKDPTTGELTAESTRGATAGQSIDSAKGTSGLDAILSMKVNGTEYKDITRSNNTFDVDGMSIKLQGTFNYDSTTGNLAADAADSAVSFTTSTDTEKIVDAVKNMINDYNEMMKEIKTAYGTLPAQKSNKTKYEPLSDEDMEGMSETAIKNYEEKAKQGIVFGDSDLSSLYSKMRFAFSPAGSDGSYLRSIGITTSYSSAEGTFSVSLDENKLKNALENNLDAVKDVFTKTKENGASTNGIMQNLKTQLDSYSKTTGATKGILVEKAGSLRAPTSLRDNGLQKQLDSIDKQIEKWQDKMSDQIDRYTSKFSRLEVLIQQMNAQSSQLSGLMGGMG